MTLKQQFYRNKGNLIRQSTSKVDFELNKFKLTIGEEKVHQFAAAFSKFCDNKLKPENEMTATLASIQSNFETIFGVRNDFIAKCLYYYLTNGYLDKDIRLPDFIRKFLAFGTLKK